MNALKVACRRLAGKPPRVARAGSVMAAVCLVLGAPWSPGEVNRSFFRVQVDGMDSVDAELTKDGRFQWTSAEPSKSFVIERVTEAGAWLPYTRGTTTSGLTSIKVVEWEPPDGMVLVPGGTFTMGDILGDLTNASPVHQVTLSPFFMKRHETTISEGAAALQWALERGKVLIAPDGTGVTNAAGEVLMDLKRYNSQVVFVGGQLQPKPGQDAFPMNYVSWFGAVSICNFLSEMAGRTPCYNLTDWTCNFEAEGYRLATEAEWECAARGGREGGRFPWTDSDTTTHARQNYKAGPRPGATEPPPYDLNPTWGLHPDYASKRPSSSPVGTFAPNPYDLYDMAGNVWEWVWDWAGKYPSASQTDPTGPATGRYRVFRGGAWLTTAERNTVASRYTSATPQGGVQDVGFRYILPYRGTAPNP